MTTAELQTALNDIITNDPNATEWTVKTVGEGTVIATIATVGFDAETKVVTLRLNAPE